ncbi:hypothetical protein KAT95_01710 [Candidatus Parcubacteria bacterium]|nr:hypothetical protein [Candidatus Parcubacteria bacterium]
MEEIEIEEQFRRVKEKARITGECQNVFNHGVGIVTAVICPNGEIDGYDGDGNRWENI